MTIDLIIRGATCVSHQGTGLTDIAVRDGIIVALGHFDEINAKTSIDATGLHILPGVIDTEFHIGSDGVPDYRAAIKGGVTSLFSVGKIETEIPCDHAFYTPATLGNISKLHDLEQEEGCAAIHLSMAASNDLDVIADDRKLLKVLKNGRRRVVVHAEDQMRLDERRSNLEKGNVNSHSLWRDERVGLDAMRRILAIARGAGRPVHVQHIAGEKEMAMIAANKDIATAAVSPHHLFLSAPDCYDKYLTYAQIDPPIGTENNRIGLWKALNNGIIDVLASQHNPQAIELKDQDYPHSPSGCPSIQTMLPQMLTQVNECTLSLQALTDLTSAGPARTFNIARKGRIAVGYDADLTFIDLTKEWTLADEDVETNCGWDLNAGNTYKGQVTGTMIRGETAMWQGEIKQGVTGKPIQFQDTFQEFEDE
ncbi:MAG: amidohydrolase family protein [Kordiimonadaceae bacterium]|nr:amidohydrolase family protein [Kordiimonadaceae bacterium]MBT6033436.1 amidohydrolase family protein [Kordiimonadaceae bacterium]